MRINEIKLYNFGSYEGTCSFDFKVDDPDKRVVVIGGKNGAGKTTLFTAIQVCLYGNYSFGYKNSGKFYLKEIYNLLNNKARLNDQSYAYVEIAFDHVDQSELASYIIRRQWNWPKGDLNESVLVYKNDCLLNEEESNNFQKYLLHLIPPAMLKLYFFDGEKIADYFLSSDEVNIYDALMILSGNDTFDILHDNVIKVMKSSEVHQESVHKDYLKAKQVVEVLSYKYQSIEHALKLCAEELEENMIRIDEYKHDYVARGGVTLDEWKDLQNALKDEEEKRDRLSLANKAAATDVLPFLMMEQLLSKIVPQINRENELNRYNALKASLESCSFGRLLEQSVEKIGSKDPQKDSQVILDSVRSYLLSDDREEVNILFDLSKEEEIAVESHVGKVKKFSRDYFKKNNFLIRQSREKSKILRSQLQNSNIENFQEFVRGLSLLEDENRKLKVKQEELMELLKKTEAEQAEEAAHLVSLRKEFEEQLKKQSVSALSGRVLLLLEELQEHLQSNILTCVENDLNEKFRQLIRKKDFFSKIKIEKDFSVHILRKQTIAKEDILSLIRRDRLASLSNALGRVAVQELMVELRVENVKDLRKKIEDSSCNGYLLSVEMDKNRLSSGEKQILVMSLYWAMMNQSKNELPFIIDTPFARIDTEHRANITNEFFKTLSGQLIILSTDEELSGRHLADLSEQISHIYMLEYGEDKATHIHSNRYFEV